MCGDTLASMSMQQTKLDTAATHTTADCTAGHVMSAAIFTSLSGHNIVILYTYIAKDWLMETPTIRKCGKKHL